MENKSGFPQLSRIHGQAGQCPCSLLPGMLPTGSLCFKCFKSHCSVEGVLIIQVNIFCLCAVFFLSSILVKSVLCHEFRTGVESSNFSPPSHFPHLLLGHIQKLQRSRVCFPKGSSRGRRAVMHQAQGTPTPSPGSSSTAGLSWSFLRDSPELQVSTFQ